MASPSGNTRALLTARVGTKCRTGAIRVGFTPKDTNNEFYIWTMQRGTIDKEPGGVDSVWTAETISGGATWTAETVAGGATWTSQKS